MSDKPKLTLVGKPAAQEPKGEIAAVDPVCPWHGDGCFLNVEVHQYSQPGTWWGQAVWDCGASGPTADAATGAEASWKAINAANNR